MMDLQEFRLILSLCKPERIYKRLYDGDRIGHLGGIRLLNFNDSSIFIY